ncbi:MULTISPECIES: UDP-glucose dehydrogenase family protein [Bacillus cereus group]|uniref:UDP-glucose dehydrogenase family protein n=1 Tax=Bacillus cereus group TaxID=86661 RepID=UPI00034BD637|nr:MULTISPECIES: UDP-glucose/GDP-mannose dehydrogenase family protein [Bacillus cereus group]MBJ8022981.1 UDP-glucose/GDP-mannose dehydrogenase family protein [Bacillus cereus]MBJ8034131.1 UDP-glucose/GDP-mannose dehydrogenase family protein [Bacillus cereus]MCH5448607.1 UDP-glucose/GDP-mannose dehydrogenase family protein [Bacillus cereus]MCU5603862.1 UDP-glucose/GDP-mannose dehydrogenase family protein [Bacillus cereus]MDY8163768.1 UDP-glucose/GDP-mannose dehydrogenase family protein [Bacill
MNIAVVGTGYVGLVTGVGLSEVGHSVTCIDMDEKKVEKMQGGQSPIYEPGLDELMLKNIEAGRLNFTTDHLIAFKEAQVIYIAVGTPENEDGTANLTYVNQVIEQIAQNIKQDIIVVTKSTVPVGTNHYIKGRLKELLVEDIKIEVVSNPEFLREGSAVYDIFNGDRIVIGAECDEALEVMRKVNKPFGIPIYETDICSAEMIKYASNAFLATKISFINEIANVCEKVGADVEKVALGMGLDSRVGNQFLKAGIGYGGSCFPKDTKALKKIAENVDYDFSLLSSVIQFNNKQQRKLLDQAIKDFGTLEGKKVGILGLTFKPNTDDMREAASLVIIPELIEMGAHVKAYDPIAIDNAKKILPSTIEYTNEVIEAIEDTEIVFILTEWDEIKSIPLEKFENKMKDPNIYDGRNCFGIEAVKNSNINYFSVGREAIKRSNVRV